MARHFVPATLMMIAGLAWPAAADFEASQPAPVAPAAAAAKLNKPAAAMLRFPAISKDFICFAYANDLYLAPRTGGMATPLSTRVGAESFPRFSPDGKTLAFVGRYDGNSEIYTMPVNGGAGGEASRVTHHPAGEILAGWYPDGKDLLMITNGFAGLPRQSQLWSVPATGGMPTQLPVPYGGFGSISDDGKWLVYSLHVTDNRTWKRYRGGMATDIWMFNLETKAAKKITDWEGTDTLPMWNGGKVYYLSDQGPEHRLNVWVFDPQTDAREQLTTFKDNDVRWPGMGPGDAGQGEIVFQLGPVLRVLDLKTRQSRELTITIPGSKPLVAQRTVEGAAKVSSTSISPTGKRIAASGRGDIWTLPAKEGVVRRLTATNGVFERDVAWSPDGRWICYFSDESGEYELYLRSSGAKEEVKKDESDKIKDESKKEEGKKEEGKADEPKKDEPIKDEAKKDEDKKEDVKKEDAKTEQKKGEVVVRKLTSMGPGFRIGTQWSPDSKFIVFHDSNGVLYMVDVEKAETKTIDTDPQMTGPTVAFSHDSAWMAYSLTSAARQNSSIWLYNMKSGEKSEIISPMFNSGSPTFDRKGDWLYFTSQQAINNPKYADIDLTFIYSGTEVLMAAPLRKDVKWPILPKNDDEVIKPEGSKADEKKDDKKDEPKKDDKKEDKPLAAADDPVSGSWSCTVNGPAEVIPGGTVPFFLNIRLEEGTKVVGKITSVMGSADVNGSYDKSSGIMKFSISMNKVEVAMEAKIAGGSFTGTWSVGEMAGTMNGTRNTPKSNEKKDDKKDDKQDDKKVDAAGDKKDDKKSGKDKKKEDPIKIDIEGFEARAMMLPMAPGGFGNIAVTEDNKLIYVRSAGRGEASGGGGIKIFDPKDDTREEKAVTGGGGFELSADGKKILVGTTIYDAAAGGGKAQPVPTAGTRMSLLPREEWKQIVTDAWRIFRDYFYVADMHGVDWPKVLNHYLPMVEDANSRDDVQFIIGEMISELNVGHAYAQDPGDVEAAPAAVGVGLLGADFELVTEGTTKAYRIKRILTGGPWDGDGKGPLSIPGIDIKAGQYVLAVNGTPVDTSKDIYAAFIATADRVVGVTVSDKPVMDGAEKEVLVKPVGSEANLRYRWWIETKRKYIFDKSEGKIGYIYVPNTGADGQNDLFRQFAGQRGMDALIIDDRWNGGGQIPTRFIEMLNRPATNYWARRGGEKADWTWPPDSHQGPKAMLINGLAGSGGDMFPWLFKRTKLGKLIGTRTWGGLVGISGNPALIDGGTIAVPTFGFYETDGTWGIEGHGVDPDLMVLDDPSKMQDDGDPQLDVAISTLLDEIKTGGYKRPARPAAPNRSGMGIQDKDK